MKFVIFHGLKGSPEDYWYPWLKQELEAQGHTVLVPLLPHAHVPDHEIWVRFARQCIAYDRDTVLIGHAHGAALILGLLEELETSIRSAFFVAGFHVPPLASVQYPILTQQYDWDLIRSRCRAFVVINSDNDPWGASEAIGRDLAEKLGGEFVLNRGEGHMGSKMFNQPYATFPLLLKLIGKS